MKYALRKKRKVIRVYNYEDLSEITFDYAQKAKTRFRAIDKSGKKLDEIIFIPGPIWWRMKFREFLEKEKIEMKITVVK